MKKFTTKEFVGVTLFAAISVVMGAIPQFGYIKLGFLPIDITLLFIPVLLGTILYGRKAGLILGLVFGLSSLIVAWFRAATPFDLAFRNPIVSVVPRVIFPMFFLLIYDIQEKLNPKIMCIAFSVIFILTGGYLLYAKWDLTVSLVVLFLGLVCIILTLVSHYYDYAKVKYLIPALLSVILHSIMVVSAIGLLYFEAINKEYGFENVSAFIIIIVISNGIIEAATTSFLIQIISPRIKEVVTNE